MRKDLKLCQRAPDLWHKFNPVIFNLTEACAFSVLPELTASFFLFFWVASFLQKYTWYLILELDLTWRMARCRIDGSVNRC